MSNLINNTTQLELLLQKVNKLPESGSGGGGDTSVEDSLVIRTLTTYTNNRVKSIGSYAFYNYNSLTSVSFPACTSIGSYAFNGCGGLTSVSFPACTSIGSYAFKGCGGLTSVSFPACTSIGSYAFNGCLGLQSIYLGASTVCTLSNTNAFTNTGIGSTRGSIFVPASLVASYKAATNWTYFSNRIFAYN